VTDSAVSLAISAAAGFILVELTYRTKFEVRRANSQQLAFFTTVAALFLFIVSRAVLSGMSRELPAVHLEVRAGWLAIIPTNAPPWLGTATVSVLIAASFPWAINRWWWPRDRANRRAIENYGTEFERLMLSALDHQMPIAVTLKSRKVYVGRITGMPPILEVQKLTDIRLLPYVSGYRDEKSFAYKFTTTYVDVCQRILDAAVQGDEWNGDPIFKRLRLQNFEIVIPLAEITTAHMFEGRLYANYGDLFAPNKSSQPAGPPTHPA